jgi:DNA mismatch repair protein MutS2
MGRAGVVESPLKGNTVTAKVNNVRMRVPIDDVRIMDKKAAAGAPTAHRPLTGPLLAGDAIRTSANTLDLRGTTVDEGATRVDAFLDRALRQQTDVVYILTGFGTGALTTGIRRHLDRSPYVETHRPGDEGEGGDAVTAVFLR